MAPFWHPVEAYWCHSWPQPGTSTSSPVTRRAPAQTPGRPLLPGTGPSGTYDLTGCRGQRKQPQCCGASPSRSYGAPGRRPPGPRARHASAAQHRGPLGVRVDPGHHRLLSVELGLDHEGIAHLLPTFLNPHSARTAAAASAPCVRGSSRSPLVPRHRLMASGRGHATIGTMERSCEALIEEAEVAPIEGWDFSWLNGRATEQRPSWGYSRLLAERAKGVSSLLDLQTGGGELLGQLPRLPPLTVATEGWEPNVCRAARRLHPRHAWVVVAQEDRATLPFGAGPSTSLSADIRS